MVPEVVCTACLLQHGDRFWILADNLAFTDLLLDGLVLLLLVMVYELSRDLPVMIACRLAIRVVVMYLQEIKVSVLVLQEITDELIQVSFVSGINIHL